jgi:hypothetical protein
MSDNLAHGPPERDQTQDTERAQPDVETQRVYDLQAREFSRATSRLIHFTYEVKLFVMSVVENIPSKNVESASPKRRPDLPGFPCDLCIQDVVECAETLYQLVRRGSFENGCVPYFEPSPLAFAWVRNVLYSLMNEWEWQLIQLIPDPSSNETASRSPGSLMPCSEYSYYSAYVYYETEREHYVGVLSRNTRRATIDDDTLTSLRMALELLRKCCLDTCESPGKWRDQHKDEAVYLPPFEAVFSDSPDREWERPSMLPAFSSEEPTGSPTRTVSLGLGNGQPSSSTVGQLLHPDRPDLVTLNQAASIVHKKKRTLEHYKTRGMLPPPTVEGGGGRADLWEWRVIRPWLEATFHMRLPDTFPANRSR